MNDICIRIYLCNVCKREKIVAANAEPATAMLRQELMLPTDSKLRDRALRR